METKVLEVRDFWIELENVGEGVLLQKNNGAEVYYLYSDDVPDRKRDGTVLNKTDIPVSLFGGRIWVKSEGYTRITYIAAKVDRPGLSDDIGNLDNLPTVNKESLVDSIIELELRIRDTESSKYHAYYHVLSNTEIADKQLILQHTPNRNTVNIQPHMGVSQFLDIDFTITGNILSWDTLALELLLTEGTLLFISYIRE